MREKILAALKKLGPSTPTEIGNHLGEDTGKLGYHLRAMLADKALKAQGVTNSRRYALPDQVFPAAEKSAAASAPRTAAAAAGRSKPKKRKSAPPQPHQAPGEFIAAITTDHRLVLIEDGAPRIFNPEHTSAIADLALAHFEA